jgi:hypothetical protein
LKENLFWRNYFFHCEKARDKFLVTYRSNSNNRPERESRVPVSEVSVGYGQYSTEIDRYNSGEDDQLSLVPAASVDEDEDASYVIPSAPTSLNTFPETRSVDDLVLVGESTDTTMY